MATRLLSTPFTTRLGCGAFDFTTSAFNHNVYDPNNPTGLNNNSVWSVYEDRTGTLWAGSFSGGVEVLRPASDAIQLFSLIVDDTASLGNNSVVGFAQDRGGMVWIAKRIAR